MILDYLQTETGSEFPSRTDPYSKGMFITLSNSKLYYNHLLGTFKRQYQSVLRGLGIKIGRKCIRQSNRMPSKSKIINLIQKGIPIATAAIHDNPDAERDGKYYQHSHFMLYNVSHYLPSDVINLRSAISKIKRANGRYVGNRHKVNGVDVRPVGTYKHYTNEQFNDDSFYDYLHNPLNSPNRDCLINYISKNRHNPDVNYRLTYLYHNNDYLPVNLSNRTITTN